MPDAAHYDRIALRHNTALGRWLEDAVDDADDGVTTVYPPAKKPAPKPSSNGPKGDTGEVMTQRMRIWLSDADHERVKSEAYRRRVAPNEVVRLAVKAWLANVGDEEAGYEVDPVPVVPEPGEQVGDVPEASEGIQPEGAE